MSKKIEEIKVKNPKNLKLYGKCMELNKIVYQLVKQFPYIENNNLKSQLIRSATSIGANVVEGNGQIYLSKEITFFNNALGSAQESLYWVQLSANNGYISEEQFKEADDLLQEIIRMIIAMMKKLNNEVA
ncbi:four helix bundle protein [Tepidibacillus sp. HK-1]|uniref:four helix bundle protein n=1 Tax=Tepidibacillus sp. HK-1 TaxID=1883407 RepID=UPI00085387B0|nr:four helix bundle protein [Tepidibacillus sp. HK-1]GBF12609.1 hypothetical protein HK1_02676 [Tepidibacillus sp. HK-1]